MKFEILQKTPLYDAFSEVGRRIFLPQGIFYWAERAKKEAELVGTLGAAYAYEKDFINGGKFEWLPCYLKEIEEFSNLSIKEIVPYTSIGGLRETRNIWKEWILKKSLYSKIEEVEFITRLKKFIITPVITGGVTNGIFQASTLFIDQNESVIVPNKRWGNYDNIISKFIGAKIKTFEFFNGNEINVESMETIINQLAKRQKKVVILLNFPNNPTGYVPTKKEGFEIVNILRECQLNHNKPIIALIDDAYEPYLFKETVLNRSIFYDLHQLDEDVIPIKLDGITKELLIYGGRIGFLTLGLKPSWIKSDEELEILKTEINNKLEGFTRATISNCNSFYQYLTYKLLSKKEMDQIVQSRNQVKELLKMRYLCINAELDKLNNSNVSIDPNSGGFFVFINLNPNVIMAKEFADHLLKKYKVGIIPIENLDENVNGIRIAYCSIDLKEIPELINRIKLALEDF
jgi:aspartate/methionine/tyrosine aminotransferase